MKLLRLALIAFILQSRPLTSFAGGMTSSGGELITDEQNPWFVGDRPVSYCIIGRGATLPKEKATQWISEVIHDWAETIQAFKPVPIQLANGQLQNLTTEFKLLYVSKMEAIFRKECELAFVIGIPFTEDYASNGPIIGSDVSEHWLTKELIGFAHRTSFDPVSGRGRGFIYLTSDSISEGSAVYHGPKSRLDFWSSEITFKQVIAHELGHVFGLSHDARHLMSHGVPADVIRNPRTYLAPQGLYTMTSHIREQDSCAASTALEGGFTAITDLFQVGEIKDLCWREELEQSDGLKFTISGHGGVSTRNLHFVQSRMSTESIGGLYIRKIENTLAPKFEVIRHEFFQFPTEFQYYLTLHYQATKVPIIFTSVDLGFFEITTFRDGDFYTQGFIMDDSISSIPPREWR